MNAVVGLEKLILRRAHGGPRTITVVAGERHLAADAGLAAMHDADVQFYQRGKDLVRVLRLKMKQSDGSDVLIPGVQPVDRTVMVRVLAQSAQWRKINAKRKEIPTDPPREVADQILSMVNEWPFPILRGVIGTQTMRYDGTLLTEPGYDAATGLVLFEPPPLPAIADQPTQKDALEAVALINDLLDEFSFADDNDVSRSAAVSMILTATLRGAMPVAPMHVISKPAPGTGGSYLQDIVSAIATGECCPVITLAPEDARENDKRLRAAALTGQQIIALDNVSSVLNGDFLCTLIERPGMLQIRALGSSDQIPVANGSFIMGNGNNLVVGADTVRRVVQVVLDTDMESPESRTFNRRPVEEIKADRGRYVAAVLTIARAYVVAGRPGCLPPTPSFEAWSNTVRSTLVWLGWPDPTTSVEKVRAEDPIRNALLAALSAWAAELRVNTGYHTSELVKFASERRSDGELVRPELWDAFFAVAPKNGQIDPIKFGVWLGQNVNRVIAGHKLIADRVQNKARPRWIIVPR